MEKQWMLAYPRQGMWYHIENLLDAGEIKQAATGYLITHEIKVATICGKDDMRNWVLDTQQKIKAFYWYLKNSINTADLKLRMLVKQK